MIGNAMHFRNANYSALGGHNVTVFGLFALLWDNNRELDILVRQEQTREIKCHEFEGLSVRVEDQWFYVGHGVQGRDFHQQFQDYALWGLCASTKVVIDAQRRDE
ncbi:hypothetical protein AVEN_159005-1 [Araneus ventricosus]|uniref:Uncharacterized protein n=1 Tax=Araneus ventricosus TaxID=182803 RepID=A0A4Y2BBS9_ARAVE|nr:hypothetical protein AVEN_159005-1 [Araneus ventricosus]